MELLFLKPSYVWLLPLTAIFYLIWRQLRKPRFVATTTLEWMQPHLLRISVVRYLPSFLLATALGLITLSLMEPVMPYPESEIESQGLDIAIILDLSASMQELMSSQSIPVTDSSPGNQTTQSMSMTPAGKTRLETTKDALRNFIGQRNDDRIGLIVFSDNAYVVSPLTFDYDYLIHYLNMIDEQTLHEEGMTAIGEGMALTDYLLHKQRLDDRRSQVIMIFTDGEHNTGRDPLEIFPQIYGAGIRTHLIGLDLEEKKTTNKPIQAMIEAVDRYGGMYFDANSESDLLAVSSEINKMEKGSIISKEYTRQIPIYQWFALSAVLLILGAVTLRAIPYFSDYT